MATEVVLAIVCCSLPGGLSFALLAWAWWGEFRKRMWGQWWDREGSAAADREVAEWKKREGIR